MANLEMLIAAVREKLAKTNGEGPACYRLPRKIGPEIGLAARSKVVPALLLDGHAVMRRGLLDIGEGKAAIGV